MSFLTEARRRATRRKSRWNLLIFVIWFPSWLLLWWASLRMAWAFHGFVYPTHAASFEAFINQKPQSFSQYVAGLLVLLAPLFPTLLGSAMIANFLAHSIRPAREALDREASSHRGTAYEAVQRSFARVLGPAFIICYGVLLLVVVLPFLSS